MARRRRRACRKGKMVSTVEDRVAEAARAAWERPWEKDFSDAPIFLRYGPSPGMGIEEEILWERLGKKKPRKVDPAGAKSTPEETS